MGENLLEKYENLMFRDLDLQLKEYLDLIKNCSLDKF